MDVTLAAVASGVALAVVLIALFAVRLARSWSRGAEQRLEAAVGELEARMESMVRELGDALERAETESRRAQRLGDLAASIDLDDVLARTLEATRQIPHVDAAIVSLADGPDGRPLVATLGLLQHEADRQAPLTGPPDGRPARAIAISYRYADEAPGDDLIRGGVAVPLAGGATEAGYLAVFTRSRTVVFSDDALAELEAIAGRAAPAIENARRFAEARRLADLDALTGLHNRRYFHETLAREVARAHRYGRSLTLVVFDVDDFKAVNDRIGHLEGDTALAQAAERIRDAVRSADIACRVGGDEFGVILPESTGGDGERLARRIQRAISAEPLGVAGRLSFSAGVAEVEREDDARSFFERADATLYRAKHSGKGRVVAAGQLDEPPRVVPRRDAVSE